MNREIKFRAWDDGIMVYSNAYKDERDYSEWDYLRFFFSNIRSDAKVMQYTGLKDKKGAEIYEGDILRTETFKLMVVGWSNKFASFVLDRDGWAFNHWFGEAVDPEYCEVIGNIYNNPELIKS